MEDKIESLKIKSTPGPKPGSGKNYSWNKARNHWSIWISHNKKKIYFGCVKTEQEAIEQVARIKAELAKEE